MTEEMCHVRCIECGKVLANKWDRYQNILSQGVEIKNALTMIGLTRYCCRMRMMNPFKVPTRSDRQIDPRDIVINGETETLTIATGAPATGMAPLQAMSNPQINQQTPNQMVPVKPEYTIVPLDPTHGNIDLPAIPQVALPGIPQVALPGIPRVALPGIDNVPVEQGNIIRTYKAW